MLDALKKEHLSKLKATEIATTFKEFWKGDTENV